MKAKIPSIIITGASGFIGKFLLERYREDFLIYAIARRSDVEAGVPVHKNIHWIQWDVGDREHMKDVLEEIKGKGGADYVIHLAGYFDFEYTDNHQYLHTNINGTENVLLLSKHLHIKRFIFAGSLASCNFLYEGALIDENAIADADFHYAKSKKAGEELCRKYSVWFPCSVVRFAAIFSDWCEYAPLYKFLCTWLSGKWNARILGGKGNTAISYLHLYDLSRLLRQVIFLSDGLKDFEIFNASPEGSTSHLELYQTATRDYFGHAGKPVFMPKSLALPGVYAMTFLSKIGLMPPPFEKPWMLQYVDKKLNVISSQTRESLQWEPTPRYHILRRMLFLAVNMKSHHQEWILKNEAALKIVTKRINLVIYNILLSRKMELYQRITKIICDRENASRFSGYQKLDAATLGTYISTAYHIVMAAVRSSDWSLLIEYADELAIRRYPMGFSSREIVEVMDVIRDIMIAELVFSKELIGNKKDIYETIGMSIQVIQDELESKYEDLRMNVEMRPDESQLNDPRYIERREMIEQLSEFYRKYPSG